jgi:ergothioneine biosynthesis protein EgtB
MQSAAEILNSRSGAGLLSAYDKVRRWSCTLSEPLSAEDQMVQSMPDASPTKWHLAHTTWFFETFLLTPHLPGYKAFNPEFKIVYNSYYKQLGKHPVRNSRGNFSRPSLSEVMQYREVVDEGMRKLLASELSPDLIALIQLGLNHEQQHQELIITDIKHAFWSQPLKPAYTKSTQSAGRSTELVWHSLPGGIVETGYRGDGFSFDNECPRHEVLLRPFKLASRLVTNAEYLEFMRDGGYRRPELWLSDGWDTVCQQGWEAPLYWEREGDGWQAFTMAGMREIDGSEPVCHVSYYEADAFAHWSGKRLPLEGEWESAASEVTIAGQFA